MVVVLTADAGVRAAGAPTFGASGQIELRVISGTLSDVDGNLDLDGATVVVIDLDAGQRRRDGRRCERLMARIGTWPPVIVVTQSFDATVARSAAADAGRRLPGQAGAAGRAGAHLRARRPGAADARRRPRRRSTRSCRRSAAPASPRSRCRPRCCCSTRASAASRRPAWSISISSTAPAPTISISSRGSISARSSRGRSGSTGSCSKSCCRITRPGLAVVAAPNRPAEMRSFDPDVVTRLLDLVSSHFDYVVFDMPRTWFSWTDSVLLGSNKLFIVSEMTVPGLRHAKQLVEAIRERLGDGPAAAGDRQPLRAEDVLVRPAQDRHRAGARRRLRRPASPTTTAWCARRSTAAFRSTRSSRATRSRRSSRSWSLPQPAAKAGGAPAAGRLAEVQTVLGALTTRH